MSADPFIQAPGQWMNYDRYAYAMNNPLFYSDPTGYKWKWNYLNPGYWLSEGVQWLNDNTTGLREKMVDIGIPDFNVGYNTSQGSFHNIGNSDNIYHNQLGNDYGGVVNDAIGDAFGREAYVSGNSSLLEGISSLSYGQISFGILTFIGKKGMSVIEGEVIRQTAFNAQIANPNFKSNEIPYASFRSPGWLRFVGKWGGSVLSAWSAFDINDQFKTGQITESEMWREQGSNAVGALPIVGTGWTMGWEAGRIISNTSWYNMFKYNFWRGIYEWKMGATIESDPILWDHFHHIYKP